MFQYFGTCLVSSLQGQVCVSRFNNHIGFYWDKIFYALPILGHFSLTIFHKTFQNLANYNIMVLCWRILFMDPPSTSRLLIEICP